MTSWGGDCSGRKIGEMKTIDQLTRFNVVMTRQDMGVVTVGLVAVGVVSVWAMTVGLVAVGVVTVCAMTVRVMKVDGVDSLGGDT